MWNTLPTFEHLRLLFRDRDDADRAIGRELSLGRDPSASRLHIAERREGERLVAVAAIRLLGHATAECLRPVALPGQESQLAPLVDRLHGLLRTRGIDWCQATTSVSEERTNDARWPEALGYTWLADVETLQGSLLVETPVIDGVRLVLGEEPSGNVPPEVFATTLADSNDVAARVARPPEAFWSALVASATVPRTRRILHEGEEVGCLLADEPSHQVWTLLFLGVAPPHRRRGVAHAALVEWQHEALKRRAPCGLATCAVGNEAAHRLYARSGFVSPCERHALWGRHS